MVLAAKDKLVEPIFLIILVNPLIFNFNFENIVGS